jgi:hypothetical protein
MYQHQITNNSLQSTDPSLFAKVLFSIDTALQTHWRSCCEANNHVSVNDKVLIMDNYQDKILRPLYFQQIPKSIQDKIVDPNDLKNLGRGRDKFLNRKDGLEFERKTPDDTETIVNKEKSHIHWKL